MSWVAETKTCHQGSRRNKGYTNMKQKFKIFNMSGILSCMPVDPGLKRLWQEDWDIEASLDYIVET